ncbi:class D sortase [Turicibacter sanguinis]|uniref:class D sortase n=1 Tax=Turicibacter sanguinis TaxID=154288 RepID=UPI0018A9B0B8|nr:class D sortase [Turicibacter sanguinis]MDB8550941.1 class D sortase [Turicibacter sanguinis]
MKSVKQRRRHFLKKIGITLVIPLFLMVVGSMMMLIPLWGMISETINYSSLIFYNPNVEVQETQFTINDQTMYRPLIGSQFATLKIENVELEVPILQGEGKDELRKGVGHYVGSLLPGEGGNIVLSGHRETAFYPLKDVEIGDEVIIETDYGQYLYQISDIYITTPDDITPTIPTDTERITMYTCYPFVKWGPTPERYVVVADLIDMK